MKPNVSRSGVYKILKRHRETGSAPPNVRSTPSRRVITPNLIKKTLEKIRRNPKRSIRKLSSEANISFGMMQTVMKIDLNLSPFKKRMHAINYESDVCKPSSTPAVLNQIVIVLLHLVSNKRKMKNVEMHACCFPNTVLLLRHRNTVVLTLTDSVLIVSVYTVRF